MPKLYKKLIDIIALLCLAAVFLFTFSYLKSWWTEEIGEKRQEQNIWKEKRTGTWCTIKSNSLDGVPIYDEQEEVYRLALCLRESFVNLRIAR